MNANTSYVLDEVVVFSGKAEYITRDRWVGIRQTNGRLDEVPLNFARFEDVDACLALARKAGILDLELE